MAFVDWAGRGGWEKDAGGNGGSLFPGDAPVWGSHVRPYAGFTVKYGQEIAIYGTEFVPA